MRRVLLVVSAALLGLLLMETSSARPMPRACGGFTIADDEPCCVSGTVTLEGQPLKGATVVALHVASGREVIDITDYAAPYDLFPSYGFLLDGPELKAEPGDTIQLIVSYKKYSHKLRFVVQPGEQWLDIELLQTKRGPRAEH